MKVAHRSLLVLAPLIDLFACAAEGRATKSQDDAIAKSVSIETAFAVRDSGAGAQSTSSDGGHA